MSGLRNLTGRYVVALVFSIIAEIILFIQPIAYTAEFLGKGKIYLYTNNEYSQSLSQASVRSYQTLGKPTSFT